MSISRSNSDRHQRSPWFETLVHEHYSYGSVIASIEHINDSHLQQLGIDMRVTRLPSGLIDLCENKFRETVYDDVLLERYHESLIDGSKKAGWINRDDYLCNRFLYVFVPIQCMLIMNWSDLRRAWNAHREEWLRDYREVLSTKENSGYRTISLAVPINVLFGCFPILRVGQWPKAISSSP